MKNKIILGVIGLFMVMLLFQLIPNNYGSHLDYGKAQLYYQSSVTEAEARQVGDWLTKNEYFEAGRPIVLQLAKNGETLQLRFMVNRTGWEQRNYRAAFAWLRNDIEAKLGKPIEVQLCDRKLKTRYSIVKDQNIDKPL